MELDLFFNSWITIVITIGGAIGLVLSAFYYWTKSMRDRRNEEDENEAKIKGLWRERFSLQDDKIVDLQKQIDAQTSNILILRRDQKDLELDNLRYVKIFQGKDEDTSKYKEEGREAMKNLTQNLHLSTEILEEMKNNGEKFNVMLLEIQRIYEILAQRYFEKKRKTKGNVVESTK